MIQRPETLGKFEFVILATGFNRADPIASLAVAVVISLLLFGVAIPLVVTPLSIFLFGIALVVNIFASMGLGFLLGAYAIFASKFEWALPTYVSGLLILNDSETGLPKAVMDATWITAMRTGAATAVAVKRLARRDAASFAILGCGVQGLVANHWKRLIRD